MDLLYWLILLQAPRLGIRTFYKALKYFEIPEQVLRASPEVRRKSGIFRQPTLDFLQQLEIKNLATLVAKDLDWQQNAHCHLITLIDKHYPERLKVISDPPPVLYVRGDLECLSRPQLAIVGSRNPTPGGAQNAQQFATDLAKAGLIITSGMAVGIDSEAHIGALNAKQQSIAVCGTGLDRIYPAKHKSLAHQISMQGALVSEFAIGTAPIAHNFPKRNRIISALSLGTLVVEASIKSGTMITAKLAADQGREVFAIPSSIHNPLGAGCHQLIKQGAMLVTEPADILQALPQEALQMLSPVASLSTSFAQTDSPINTQIDTQIEKPIETQTDAFIKNPHTPASILLKYLSYDSITIDALVEKSGLSPQIVTTELLTLEFDNQVARLNGSNYVLIK